MADRRQSTTPITPDPAHEAFGLERLVFFSDAVFAIAITLLALEIRLPPGLGELSNAALRQALLAQRMSIFGFVISFLVIGTFWVGHHRRFMWIRRYDRRLLWLNLFLLMFVAFAPFPTSVLSEYGNRTATIFYALTMASIGLLQVLIWWYATAGRRLVDANMPHQQVRREMLRLAAAPAVFLLSIALAYVNDDVAKFSWLLLLPLAYVLR